MTSQSFHKVILMNLWSPVRLWRLWSSINCFTTAAVLNTSVRLRSSDYSELNTQPAGENYANAYLSIFNPEYFNVEHF